MRRRRATVAAVATPGEWKCKTARSSEWAQHFSNASRSLNFMSLVSCVCFSLRVCVCDNGRICAKNVRFS